MKVKVVNHEKLEILKCEPKVNFCNGLLLESMHIFTVNYHVLATRLATNGQITTLSGKAVRPQLRFHFVSQRRNFVPANMNQSIKESTEFKTKNYFSYLGIKKVDMLNKSKNILYLSLNVERRYCERRNELL